MTTLRQGRETPIIPAQRRGVTVLCAHAFLAILVGLALRLFFAFRFPAPADDSGTYIQLALNWIDHQIYGLWVNGNLVPTDLRPPGYPAFLAGVAMILGRSTRAIMLSQCVVDLGTCLLAVALSAALAPVAARRRAAIAALWLSVTCPFVANYSAVVLSEVLTAFLTTGALLSFAVGLAPETPQSVFTIWNWRVTPRRLALLGSVLTGVATLVRPEMPLLFAVAGTTFALRWWKAVPFRKLVLNGVAMAGAFLLPVAPWAARNLIVLNEVQFLSPRYSTLPGEYATVGYFAWTNTWLERYRDVYLNIWKIGEEPVEMEDLPEEAFDSLQEKAQIAEVFQQYNTSPNLDISPEMDREFARIARERTRRNPLRTYVRVPFQRALTLWFTPRTELLPIDGKLWPIRDQWHDSHAAFLTTAGFAALGYLYVASALGGIYVAWRAGRTGSAASNAQGMPNLWGVALLLAYLLVRTAFLTTVEAPEPRYVITCYPALLALGALLCARVPRISQG
jgi:hypothetical protein